MANQWFRMYSEFAGDPVIQSLAFEDQRHYVVLLCLKNDGVLDRDIPATRRELIICRGLGLDPATAAEVKRRLMEVNLIDKSWQIPGWNKRQFVSDNVTERTRKHRNKNKTGNVPETLQERSGNAPETDTETDTEKDISAKRKTAFPKEFVVTAEMLFWMMENTPVLNANHETAKFRDWHTSKGTKYVDWVAAWRNWMRKADKYAKENTPQKAYDPRDYA